MNAPFLNHLRRASWRVAAVLAFMTVFRALADNADAYRLFPEDEPRLPWQFKYFKFDVEAEQSSQTSTGGGAQSKFDRLYFSPGLGIGLDYYLYHPDLLTYSILAEPGYRWQDSGPPGGLSLQEDVILNGNLSATLLQLKPYTTILSASADHTTHQYDFFNSVTEDTQTWGITSGYREGPVPTTVSFEQSMRQSSGLASDSENAQSTLNVHSLNERQKQNITDFSYQYNDYRSTLTSSGEKFHDASRLHYLTLNDTEHFDRAILASGLIYNHSEDSADVSDDLSTTLDLRVDHTPRLQSFYNYSFSWYGNQTGNSYQNYARAGLQHQLFESLTTSADVHGNTVNDQYTGSSLRSQTIGTAGSTTYTKRLGSWGRLTLGDTANFDFTDQQSSGAALLVPNEAHVLLTGVWVRLNQPRDITIISVTTSLNVPLTENVDYVVDRTRDPWQIQIVPTSVLIVSGNTVLVSYTVQPNPSGSYSTFNNQAQIRLDLWNGLADVYGRYSFTENFPNAPGFVLEDVSELQAGSDFCYNRLRLSANYTKRDSSFYDYYAYTLSEGYSRTIANDSTIGLNLSQRWSFYPGSNNGVTNLPTQEVDYYDFMLRYDWHPIRSINWSVEGGYEQQRGNGLNEDLYVARSYLNWIVGKLDFHLGYEYQKQKYTAQTRDRHFVFLHLRRNF